MVNRLLTLDVVPNTANKDAFITKQVSINIQIEVKILLFIFLFGLIDSSNTVSKNAEPIENIDEDRCIEKYNETL